MTAFFVITTIICGVAILFLLADRSVKESALEELQTANRELERRLTDCRKAAYKPEPGDFNRLHSIQGGRRG